MKKRFLNTLGILLLALLTPLSVGAQRPQRTMGPNTELKKRVPSQARKHLGASAKPSPRLDTRQLQQRYAGNNYLRNAAKIPLTYGNTNLFAPPVQTMPLYAGSDAPVFWGNVVGQASWENLQPSEYRYGMYQFKGSSDISLDKLAVHENFNANGGGAFFDGQFHFITYATMEGVGTFAQYFVYDTKTWKIVSTQEVADLGNIAVTSSYDPATKRLYGSFYQSDMQGFEFGYYDYADMKKTTIKSLDDWYMAMAVNAEGELYAIDKVGNLLKVDKNTGAETKIGPTGLSPYWQQSMTFDRKTGKLYWAASFYSSPSGLYEVDTTTGKAAKITNFPDNEQILCLYVPDPAAAEGAPDKISDLAINFEKGATTGNVTFTAPSTSYAGGKLTGTLNYVVKVNNMQKAQGTAVPGEKVSVPLTVDGGQTVFEVTTSNESGISPAAQMESWIGFDTPLPPTNLKMDLNEETGQVKLTWDRPASGAHGGYVDYDNMVYYVYRVGSLKSKAQKGLSYEETIDVNGKLDYYYYEVGAANKEGNPIGDHAYTREFVLGAPIKPDFTEKFDSNNKFRLFTVVDVNEDGKTWEYMKNGSTRLARAMGSETVSSDDWLMSPPLRLEPEQFYKVSFKARRGLTSYPEKLSVWYGNGKKPSDMKMQILPTTELPDQSDFTTYTAEISVKEAGTYYVGFHAESDPGQFAVYVDNISIVNGVTFDAPDSVTNLKAVAGAEGAPQVTISFKAPTQTIKKDELTSLSKIELFRGEELIKTFDNPQPGADLTYTDDAVTNGLVTYTVAATNAVGTGMKAKCSVFVGYDVPVAPRNITLKDNLDGTLGLSWETPGKIGANGGYVDDENVTYNVYSVDPETGDATLLKGDLEEMSLKIENVKLDGRQDVLYYDVSAKSENNEEGEHGISNIIVKGTPYELPYSESLVNGLLKYNDFWWVETSSSDTPDFKATNEMSADGDDGCVFWQSGAIGQWASFNSGKIALQSATNPELMFNYYAVPQKDVKLIVEAYPAGKDKEEVAEIYFKTLTGSAGWRQAIVNLTDVKDAPYTIIKFRIESNETTVLTALDNFLIMDMYKYNLAASIKCPTAGTVGKPMTVNVNVKNNGSETASGFTVDLYAGKRLVESVDGGTLKMFEDKTYEFTYVPKIEEEGTVNVHAVANYKEELAPADNTTEDVAVTVKQPELPTVVDLTASTSGEGNVVNLKWSEPASLDRTIIDDMEGYETWTIDAFGDWTVIDRDQLPTTGVEGFRWENLGVPQAFIVFDAAECGLGALPRYKAHSGSQYLASFAAYSETGESVNDDWLISPELKGDAQTISLWAKGASLTYVPETFEILYSTTDDNPESFKVISKNNPEGDIWSEYTADLPEGTKYFAIHCISNDKLALLIDDITYHNGKLKVAGYTIFRDGEKIASVDAGVHSFVDDKAANGMHVYNVKVNYVSDGESVFSNDAATTVVNTISSLGDNTLSVRTSNGAIKVENIGGEPVYVYTAGGVLVFHADNRSEVTVPVQRGQYLVKVGSKTFNVTVK